MDLIPLPQGPDGFIPPLEIEADGDVTCEVFRHSRRRMNGEIGRRRAEPVPVCEQFPDDEIGRGGAGNPKGKIDPVLDEVQHALADQNLDLCVRMAAQKTVDRFGEKQVRQIGRNSHAQFTRKALLFAADGLVGITERGNPLAAMIEIGLARFCNPERFVGPVDQPDLQLRLKLGDLPAHGGKRHVQTARRAREAALPDDFHKNSNGVEVFHQIPNLEYYFQK